MVLVQPGTYIAGHILDRCEELYGAEHISKKIKTGGAFNPAEPPIYFIASNIDSLRLAAPADHRLIAVNEINEPADMDVIERWIDAGVEECSSTAASSISRNEHARAHQVTMDQALTLAPEEIDGFDDLWDRYLGVIRRLGNKAWGYIELDQGGLENKRRTRARLEALGLRPHRCIAFNDGLDYFDELTDRYDRICFGNVVQADVTTRKKLVATAWERHRRHPDLWIHLLGLTPNELLYALPINSGDSSVWLSSVRWSGYNEHAAGRTLGPMPLNFRYRLGSETDAEDGRAKANVIATTAPP